MRNLLRFLAEDRLNVYDLFVFVCGVVLISYALILGTGCRYFPVKNVNHGGIHVSH